MKSIEEAALDYVNSTSIIFPEDAVKKAFKAGVEFAQKWISVKFTPEWVKENLCMEDGNDITECYSDGTIEHISWLLCAWEDFDYKDAKEVLNQFHLTIKNK